MASQANPRTEVQVAPFELGDMHELATLAVATQAAAHGHAIPEEVLPIIASTHGIQQFERAAQAGDAVLVAKLGERVVGYTQFGKPGPDEVVPPISRELRKLYVATDRLGEGIGPQLMDVALVDPMLAKTPLLYLWVWGENKRAIKFYRGYGFDGVVVRGYAKSDGSPTHDLMMIRSQVAAG